MTKSIFMPVLFSRKLKTLNVHINKIVRTAASGYFKILSTSFYSFATNNCKFNLWDTYMKFIFSCLVEVYSDIS